MSRFIAAVRLRGMPSRLLLVALCVLLAGCPAKLPVLTEPSCQGVDCSGQGTCALIHGAGATCLCNAGFRAEGTSCVAVQPGQECAGVTCSGHGQCLVLQGPPATPLCRCESGYREVGATSCVPLANPCEGVTCGGNGTCAVRGAEAVCVCNGGWRT